MKKYAVGALGVLVIIAAAIAYTATRPTPHLLTGSVNANGDFVYESHGEFYDVTLTMPDRTPLWKWWDTAADTKARLSIESDLKDANDQFMSDSQATSTTLENSPWMADGRKYTLSDEYAASTTAHTVSYEFELYEDTGGAHPNAAYDTFVFDRSGTRLKLNDLFAPDSKYLPIIASDASAEVKAEIGRRLGLSDADAESAVFEDGLAATDDNFSNFIVTPTELVFFLPPYQVAPYAAGTFEVHVPISQVRDILRKDIP